MMSQVLQAIKGPKLCTDSPDHAQTSQIQDCMFTWPGISSSDRELLLTVLALAEVSRSQHGNEEQCEQSGPGPSVTVPGLYDHQAGIFVRPTSEMIQSVLALTEKGQCTTDGACVVPDDW